MKNLILLTTILLHSFSVFAQVSNTNDTANNQVLLNNAATSETNWNNANGNKQPTSIKILSNGGSSQATTSSANLTDQEKQLSENYVDQAGGNKIIEEKCIKAGSEMDQACKGIEVDHKVLGMSPGLIKAAAQAYATIGAMGDFLSLSKGPAALKKDGAANAKTDVKPEAPATKTDTAATTPAEGEKAKKEKTDDNCKYIPVATETIAAFTQKNTVAGLNQGGETGQKEDLLKAAKSHDGRADQAQIQAVGWYAGAACYVYMGASGKAAWDTSLIVKLGATVLLGTFYQAEVGANKDYANKTREVANSLPGKGVCNPITQNDCYCAEPENANDPTYCKAQIAKKAAGVAAFTRTACTDSNLKLDPGCNCEKTNSCFEKFLENQGLVDLQGGMGFGNTPYKAIASLAHGKLEAGTMSSAAFAGNAAIARKALNDMSAKLPANNTPLNAAQKAVADAITSKGIPSNIAHLMALNSPSASAVSNAMGKFNGMSGGNLASSYSPTSRSNVLDFSGGDGLGTNGKKNDKKGGGADDFLSKLGQKSGRTPNSKVLEFAQKAQAKVPQITKSDKPIFEIISIRYQTSGRRLLELDPHN